jgi:hypothetical protein
VRLARLFAPAVALGAWATAAGLGVSTEVLYVVGPAVTALACVATAVEQARIFKGRHR